MNDGDVNVPEVPENEMMGPQTRAEVVKKMSDVIKDVFTKQPTISEIQALFKDHAYDIVQAGFKRALDKKMITMQQYEDIIHKYRASTEKKFVNSKGSGLTRDQEIALVNMEGWGKLFKKDMDWKINKAQISESLKKTGSRLHIIESPTSERVPLPFSLMGNKSSTFQRVIKPKIITAITHGADTYVEPYGGA